VIAPVVVLGAGGSIGRQTIEVCDWLEVPILGLAVRRPRAELVAMMQGRDETRLVVTGGSDDERDQLSKALGDRVAFGTEALAELAATPETTVVNGIVGAAGLRASMAVLEAGNRLGLANKESLVAGGPVLLEAVRRGGGELIPIDSEHSAIFQLLAGSDEIDELVITASGGPFRGRSFDALLDVTPAEALAHPTWEMGDRISIDSATLANKGLEVIEAHYLFGVPFERIDVVVHPQSVVHSLIRLVDGALLCHLGTTDMRIPIQYALTYPERAPSLVSAFDLTSTELTFEEPDTSTFRALALAYEAGREGGGLPAVFNAADEIAVEAFLTGRIGFTAIPEIIERTLESIEPRQLRTVADVLDVDAEARQSAAALVTEAC